MVGKYNGVLVGYRSYEKVIKQDGKDNEVADVKVCQTMHVYDVFCTGGRKDRETGLYKDECKVVSITETEQVLPKLEYGVKVEFYGEAKTFKDKNGNEKSYMSFSDISAVDA